MKKIYNVYFKKNNILLFSLVIYERKVDRKVLKALDKIKTIRYIEAKK